MALWRLILTLVILTNGIFALGAQPHECTSYLNFTDATRHVNTPDQSQTDHTLSAGWYRFTVNAGSYMPETCPDKVGCGAPYPGWLNGIHPTTAEGAVTKTVCYYYPSSSCCHWSNTIQVRNCGQFYVYYLPATPTSQLRYCGTDEVPGIPAECKPSGYNILDEANRYWLDESSNTTLCDMNVFTSNSWYRITGEAGTMIAPYCIPRETCNSESVGWISGTHPSDEAYKQAPASVCMHDSSSCCPQSYPVEIRNCSEFFVYRLHTSIGSCNQRLCGVKNESDACTASGGSDQCNCPTGYSGKPCQDTDECTDGSQDCHSWAFCNNTLGSFRCTCNKGFTGDGKTCIDIDECTSVNFTHDCHPDATCSNTDGTFTCSCNAGYTGDGRQCVDVDECKPNGTHNCHADALCTNTIGLFNCSCNEGYSGNGVSCSDIDECTIGTHNCHTGLAHCHNSSGSFSCECHKCYSGDGTHCSPLGDFLVTIRDISKSHRHPTIIKRSVRSVMEAIIQGIPSNFEILTSKLEWRIITEQELVASECPEGTLTSQGGTPEWTINRRSIPAGIYQVKFIVTYTVGGSASPQLITSFDYGFIKVVVAPLRAIIDGGSIARWGSINTVSVDGSLSYDSNIGPGETSGLQYAWSCVYNASVSNDCFSSFVGQTNPFYSLVSLDPSKLTIGVPYVLRLNVSKDTRHSVAEICFEVAEGDIPQVTLRCFVDCDTIVSASNKLRVTSECLNSPCTGSGYKWQLQRLNNETKAWEDTPILPNMTATAVNATNMIIKKSSLQSNSSYSLALFVTSPEGAEGFSVLNFETAGQPHSGYCTSSVSEGVALETNFTFKCSEWQDKSKPLTYEFRLGSDPISYGLSPESASTVLPAGLPQHDYKLKISIIIKNAVGVAVVETLSVKVKPSPGLDPCLAEVETVAEKLKSFVIGEDSELARLLKLGEIGKASTLSSSVLKTANEKTECGKTLSQDTKTLISNTLVEKFTSLRPESLQMSRTIVAVVILATGSQEDQTCDSCLNVEDLAMNLTDKTTDLLKSALNDLEEPFSAELEEAAESVTGCLKNVLQSSSAASETNNSQGSNSSAKENVLKASEKLDTMNDAFFKRLVPSEDLVIKAPDLAVSLKKVTPNDTKGLNMEEGATRFKLPGNLGNVGSGNVNAKMKAINFNPFTWDNSSKMIKSSVTSLDLQTGNGTKINVSNLNDNIEIVIPILSPASNTSNDTGKHYFLKPKKMTVRSYYAEMADVPVSIRLGVREGAKIRLFIKYGARPTIEDSDRNFTLVFTQKCGNLLDVKENKTFCVAEEKSVAIVPAEPSHLYIGLLLESGKNHSEHSRERRSCFGHGRERRSCVGVKDPPPKGVTTTVVPQYDPDTDVNYTFAVAQTTCLYWSANKDKWTSDGCKVDPRSNTTHLICLCNHLTSFGGNFIQAPNPIDFDKVFAEFGRLSESGNISVLVTIACTFLLYFIVVVFARRADKRDESRNCPPKCITIVKEGNYYYDMVITTGVLRHSGTTANVTISIAGERNEHNLIVLRSKEESCEIFSRGSTDGFVLITNESLGPLTQITLEHDNTGENPSWFVETVIIRDRQTEETWTFPINRWLALEKEDGEIEVTLDVKWTTSFSGQFRSRFSRKIADNHLWMSVIGKSCCSTFTRVQRASCCLSVLFSAMIANAMFYNIGGESDGAIQVGPFKFSWRQIVIGVQSGIIVAPVNILIVFVFKSSRPTTKKGNRYREHNQAQKLVDEARGAGCMLPHFCVYIGWFLCFATTLTAAAFTLFYSLMWGKEVSEQWLASIMISSSQDIFVVQPVKVMLAVAVVSLLFVRKYSDNGDSEEGSEGSQEHESDIDLVIDNPKERFKRNRLEVIRRRSKKEAQLAGILRDIILHLIFVFFLAIVCYGNKNENRFLMTTATKNSFTYFDLVTDKHRLWGWLRQKFLPNIYNQAWYNGLEEENDVYIENKMSILIGMPWMRQLRIKKRSCEAEHQVVCDCYYEYSSDLEDTTALSLPGWHPLPYNTSWPEALQICPKPWRYQTAEELNIGPIMATFSTYGGGGYVAVLGYDKVTAEGVLSETLGHGWVDRQTRAVILEFAIFNVNTNLLSICTFFYEALANGVAFTAQRVETLELYSTESGALMFYLICQFIFMAMVLAHFILLLIHLYRQRLGFFKSVWNMVDFLMIISSVASVAFYIVRSKSVLKSIKAIQENPFDIIHFHSALQWANLENASIAVAIFMVTLKMLNLIRFNPYVIYLFSSFRQSVDYQLSYLLSFAIVFNAFVMSGIQYFGRTVYDYSSYLRAVAAQFEFLLGKAVPLEDLRKENRFLGPAFAFMYLLTMTIILMNILVSVLNESYTDAKTNAEDNAEELEMARFIGESFVELFQKGKHEAEFKLFCDEATFSNLCFSDAEPFCLNSQSILNRTTERLALTDRRFSVFTRRTQNLDSDFWKEETEFLYLLLHLQPPYKSQTTHL